MIFNRKGAVAFVPIVIAIAILVLGGVFYFAQKKDFVDVKPTAPASMNLPYETPIEGYLRKNLIVASPGTQVFCTYIILGESELAAPPLHAYVWALCSEYSFKDGRAVKGKTVSSPVDLVLATKTKNIGGDIEVASYKMPTEANYKTDVENIFPPQIQSQVFEFPSSNSMELAQDEITRKVNNFLTP